MVSITDLIDVLNRIPSSRWTDRIGEGIGALAREISDRSLPAADVIEWLAEWSRETWGEQRGLKLLTAHRAKGLEFDDVAILDGGWERPSRNEDQDAPRRLFYVAMTRTRRNLIVMSNDHHEYLPSGLPSILVRRVKPDMSACPGPRRILQSAEARIVDLSFAAARRSSPCPRSNCGRSRRGWAHIGQRQRALGSEGHKRPTAWPYGNELCAASEHAIPTG